LAIRRYDLAIRRYDLAIRRYDLATHRYEAVLDSISSKTFKNQIY
jgi:molybdate-binding protein